MLCHFSVCLHVVIAAYPYHCYFVGLLILLIHLSFLPGLSGFISLLEFWAQALTHLPCVAARNNIQGW